MHAPGSSNAARPCLPAAAAAANRNRNIRNRNTRNTRNKQVLRDFRPPAGLGADDVDAAGDGEVLVVLDLRVDESLLQAGLARELVNRWGYGYHSMQGGPMQGPGGGALGGLLAVWCSRALRTARGWHTHRRLSASVLQLYLRAHTHAHTAC